MLIRAGAEIDAQDVAGKTPLMLAVRGNKYLVVKARCGLRLRVEINAGTGGPDG